jgi:hypothetical protein
MSLRWQRDDARKACMAFKRDMKYWKREALRLKQQRNELLVLLKEYNELLPDERAVAAIANAEKDVALLERSDKLKVDKKKENNQ